MATKDVAGARALIEQLDVDTAKHAYLLGRIAETQGKSTRAIEHYENARQHGLVSPSLLHRLGLLYLQVKRAAEAEMILRAALNTAGEATTAGLYLAVHRATLARGAMDRAWATLQTARTRYPNAMVLQREELEHWLQRGLTGVVSRRPGPCQIVETDVAQEHCLSLAWRLPARARLRWLRTLAEREGGLRAEEWWLLARTWWELGGLEAAELALAEAQRLAPKTRQAALAGDRLYLALARQKPEAALTQLDAIEPKTARDRAWARVLRTMQRSGLAAALIPDLP